MGRHPRPIRDWLVVCHFGKVQVKAKTPKEALRIARRADRQVQWGMKHGAIPHVTEIKEES